MNQLHILMLCFIALILAEITQVSSHEMGNRLVDGMNGGMDNMDEIKYNENYGDEEHNDNGSDKKKMGKGKKDKKKGKKGKGKKDKKKKGKGHKKKHKKKKSSEMVSTLHPTILPTDETITPTILPTIHPSDATNTPTIHPTNIPTNIPTIIPTNIPTNIPTIHPTDETNTPTWIPTGDPTTFPTRSPIGSECIQIENGNMQLDAIFVVDKSCRPSNDDFYCLLRQELIAELMTSIKGSDNGHNTTIGARVGYIAFGYDSNDVFIKVQLNDSDFNTGPIYQSDIIEYYNLIRDGLCSITGSPSGTTDLESALSVAALQLTNDGRSPPVVRKIVVFSDCMNTPSLSNPEINDICGHDLRDQIQNGNIDMLFINLGPEIIDEYGDCFNTTDIWNYPSFPNSPNIQEIIDDVVPSICDVPLTDP